MKYLSKELYDEYTRMHKMMPDIEGLSHPFINSSDVLHAYFILVDYFTDVSAPGEVETMLVGLRSTDLLGSALGRQNVSFNGVRKYTDPIEICATLFYGLVKDHAFSDGNKRTSLLILLYQLSLFGFMPCTKVTQYEKLVLAVAANELSTKFSKEWKKFEKRSDQEIQTISYLLRRMAKRKDNSYHIAPTTKDFCDALSETDVECSLSNGKLHFSREEKSGFLLKLKKSSYQYALPFNGWTRTIGPKTARETLRALNLYDQFASYQDLFDKQEPLYKLVDDFNVPLRRLKDE